MRRTSACPRTGCRRIWPAWPAAATCHPVTPAGSPTTKWPTPGSRPGDTRPVAGRR
jgi:hypothetical protein